MTPEVVREWLTTEELVRALDVVMRKYEPGEKGPQVSIETNVYRTHSGDPFAKGSWTTAAAEVHAKLLVGESFASADSVIQLVALFRDAGLEPYFTGDDDGYLHIAIGRDGQQRVPLDDAK